MIKIDRKNADILLIFVAISWGSTFVLVQNAIKDIPVFTFLAVRFFLAFLISFAMFRNKMEFNLPTILAASLLGIFNFVAYATQTYALNYTSSAVVGFITGLNVVLVPIVAYFIFKKGISIYSIIAVAISTIGVYYLTNCNGIGELGVGELLTLVCALFVALHINYTDVVAKSKNIFTLAVFQFLTVAILSSVFSLFEEKSSYTVSNSVILALIVTTLFATIFAFVVQTYAQKYTTATKAAIIFTLEPVVAALFGYFNNEPLGVNQLIGFVLIIFAIIVSEFGYIFLEKKY